MIRFLWLGCIWLLFFSLVLKLKGRSLSIKFCSSCFCTVSFLHLVFDWLCSHWHLIKPIQWFTLSLSLKLLTCIHTLAETGNLFPYIHTHTHHTLACTCPHTNAAHKWAYTHTRMHTHMHACTHTSTHTHTIVWKQYYIPSHLVAVAWKSATTSAGGEREGHEGGICFVSFQAYRWSTLQTAENTGMVD